MINKINNNLNKNNINFKNKGDLALKSAQLFLKSQENLSNTRFIQDTATNWLPKAVFSRSKEDFVEQSFLEFLESAIFYYMIPIFGEKIFRNKLFNNFQPKQIRNEVNSQLANNVKDIINNSNLTKEIKNRSISTKAGIVLACAIVPIAEYVLSFAKNLFTLKTFKKSNFNSIANLDKKNTLKEDKTQQEKVEKSAKKHLKRAGILSATFIALGSLLALNGKSDKAAKISQNIIEPGRIFAKLNQKIGIKNEKFNKFISKFNLDFANDKGKLALSKAQLGLTALIGLFGYSNAAGDRGKLDKQEVWTRVPIVVLYTTFGSELLEKGFINLLSKKDKYSSIISKNNDGKFEIPNTEQLKEIANNLATKNKTNSKDELAKLVKQKAFIGFVPYAFSIIGMGFLLSLISRIWTQHRYNIENKEKSKTQLVIGKNIPALNSFNKNI